VVDLDVLRALCVPRLELRVSLSRILDIVLVWWFVMILWKGEENDEGYSPLDIFQLLPPDIW
jgi:hypothetical protein